jgi:hypothetical protein
MDPHLLLVTVLSSLKNLTSGIVFSEKLKELNLRSQVIGDINIDISQYLTKNSQTKLTKIEVKK